MSQKTSTKRLTATFLLAAYCFPSTGCNETVTEKLSEPEPEPMPYQIRLPETEHKAKVIEKESLLFSLEDTQSKLASLLERRNLSEPIIHNQIRAIDLISDTERSAIVASIVISQKALGNKMLKEGSAYKSEMYHLNGELEGAKAIIASHKNFNDPISGALYGVSKAYGHVEAFVSILHSLKN